MKSRMINKRLYFALLAGMCLLIGCHNNPIGSGGSVWTRGTGVINVNHFYASGGNLLASTYCAPCSQAYIFLSTDEGSTWKLDTTFHVDNHIDNGYYTNDLYTSAPITFTSDGKYLLAGVSDCFRGAIYRSSDNGITWRSEGISWPENDSNHSEDINCFSVLNGNIFAGTYHGVFVSTDDGSSWQEDNVGIPDIYTGRAPSISDLATTGTSLFAATYGFGIYRSTNGGTNWVEVNTTNFDFDGGLATIGDYIFAGAFNDLGKPLTGGVFVSTDNGESWQRADADLPDHGVNAICAGGTNLFVGTNAAIYFSSDRGSTWINISSGSGIDGGGATALYVYDSFLFANSGSVRRYPLFLLPEFTQNMKNEISKKTGGG